MRKNFKDTNINLRVSKEDKLRYAQEAKQLGLDLSKYIMHLLNHKQVKVIEGGKELADAIYNLNNTLNKCISYPSIPVAKIREAVSNDIDRLNKFMTGERDDYVRTEI